MDDGLPRRKRVSWWNRRTKTEKWLFVIIGFCAVLIIYLVSHLLISSKINVCMTESCIHASTALLDKIDKSVNPCHDFYNFTCGNFIKNTRISDDQVSISSSTHIREKVQLQLRTLFEKPIQENDSHPVKLVKHIYSSCMNTTKIEEDGVDFLKKEFKNCGGWPILESNWNEKKFDWKNLLYCFSRKNFTRSFFLNMYVGPDLKNSSKQILTIAQLNLPYQVMEKGFDEPPVKAMFNFSVEVAVLFGADRETAITDAKDVVSMAVEIAKLVVRREDRLNKTSEYNPMTVRELQKNFPTMPWLKIINNYLSPVDAFTLDDVVNLAHPTYFQKLERVLSKINNRVLANDLFFGIALNSVSYLPEEFRKKRLQAQKNLIGQKEAASRWKECVSEAATLNIAVSSMYVKENVNTNTKSKISELIQDIKKSFLDTLKRVEWMDPKTKTHALLKAKKMGAFIAYPDELLDDNKVEEYYQDLDLNPDDYFLTIFHKLSNFYHIKQVLQLRKPVEKFDWKERGHTYSVNAFYSQRDNIIELPAAILQDHFFDPERPQYLNYGAIGEIIGHEITHGFDSQGRQYDKDGNLVDWWEPETADTFTKKSQCFVEQYGNCTVPEVGMSLNGLQSLAENIADNGGINIAYEGYLKWLERNKAELVLPGLPYTDRQLFWISAASNWCSKYKKEILRIRVTLGAHSPDYFRVIVPFKNSEYFAKDFNCPLASPMNPKDKCRVW